MKIWLAIGLGAVLIAVAAVCGAITPPTYTSIKPWPQGTSGTPPYRPLVDEFSWKWMNYWWANSEDGVSGQQAWIWKSGVLVPYASTFWSWVPKCAITFAWSAWRNNANNLKRPLRTDSLNKPWVP